MLAALTADEHRPDWTTAPGPTGPDLTPRSEWMRPRWAETLAAALTHRRTD